MRIAFGDRQAALADKLAQTYRAVVSKLVDLFGRVKALDQQIGEVNLSAPPGEPRRLLEVELEARKLDRFTITSPPIADKVRLPDFNRSTEMVWPLPTPSLAAQMAGCMMFSSHPGAAWADEIEARNEARRGKQAGCRVLRQAGQGTGGA